MKTASSKVDWADIAKKMLAEKKQVIAYISQQTPNASLRPNGVKFAKPFTV